LHQYSYWRVEEHAASHLRKLALGFRYDCYVSPRARVYHCGQIRLAKGVNISDGAMLNFRSGAGNGRVNLVIGRGTQIMPEVKLIPQQGHIHIGENCTIQYGCLLYGVGGLEIGDDTRIAAHTVITPMNHVYSDPLTPIWRQGETAVGIRIGRDVWIGNSVKILDGVVIGDGSVIGAGSIVNRSIPPYSVAVGTPARVVWQRGDPSGGAVMRHQEPAEVSGPNPLRRDI
jgi:acetyltransferase-like isoleucine patch superfamily enzyme